MAAGRGLIWVGLAAAVAGGGVSGADERGREVLRRHCTACHGEAQILGAHRSPDAWRATVGRMSSHRQRLSGAGFSAEVQAELLRYLGAAGG